MWSFLIPARCYVLERCRSNEGVGVGWPRGAHNRKGRCIGYCVLVGKSEEIIAREIDPT